MASGHQPDDLTPTGLLIADGRHLHLAVGIDDEEGNGFDVRAATRPALPLALQPPAGPKAKRYFRYRNNGQVAG